MNPSLTFQKFVCSTIPLTCNKSDSNFLVSINTISQESILLFLRANTVQILNTKYGENTWVRAFKVKATIKGNKISCLNFRIEKGVRTKVIKKTSKTWIGIASSFTLEKFLGSELSLGRNRAPFYTPKGTKTTRDNWANQILIGCHAFNDV